MLTFFVLSAQASALQIVFHAVSWDGYFYFSFSFFLGGWGGGKGGKKKLNFFCDFFGGCLNISRKAS